MENQQSPSPPPSGSPSSDSNGGVLGFLDQNRPLILSAVVAAATYFFPPAAALLQADPQLGALVVTGLFAALHAAPKAVAALKK